jgi:hypothetical protein
MHSEQDGMEATTCGNRGAQGHAQEHHCGHLPGFFYH